MQPRVGDYVKVEQNCERFWSLVVRVTADGAIDAIIDNALVQNELRCGDPIALRLEDVVEVARPEDCDAFTRRVIRCASIQTQGGQVNWQEAQETASLEWWDARMESGRAAQPRKSVALVGEETVDPASVPAYLTYVKRVVTV